MATIKNLVLDQGASFTATIVVKDPAGNPLDLTGATIKSQLRKSYLSTNFVDLNAVAVSPLTDGQIQISLDATGTGALKPGRYVYDVWVQESNSTAYRVLEGLVTVTPAVTK